MGKETGNPVERPVEVTPEMYRFMLAVVDQRMEEIKVAREEFDNLRSVVMQLTEAQMRAEECLGRLESAVEKLTQAQARTEQHVGTLEAAVERLAQAQARTEQRVEELAQAQARTEDRLEELAQVQIRFERTFVTSMGALGARWGLDTEESFREAIRAILEDVGFKVERYLAYDAAGKVFDRPAQVELDVVLQDAKLMVIEIKSSVSRADVSIFGRKVAFYEEQEGKKADRRIIVSPFVDEKGKELALAMDMEVYTRADDLAKE